MASSSPLTRRGLLQSLTPIMALGAGGALLPPTMVRAQADVGRASAWAAGLKSRARLVGGGAQGDGGKILAGIEIALDPHTLTYWRSPGEAGVPPRFDWSRSRNAVGVEVLYPAPTRLTEGGSEAFGYQGGIVLPIEITPEVAGRPVALALEFDYAVCERICIPVHAALALDVAGDGAPLPAVRAARATVPRLLSAAEAAQTVRIAALSGTPPRWRISVSGARDLFAEASDGSYVTTRRDGEDFILTQQEASADAPPLAEVTLTCLGTAGPFEWHQPLDAGGARL